MGVSGDRGQKGQTSGYKIHKSWEAMYSLVTTVSDAVLYTGKLPRE